MPGVPPKGDEVAGVETPAISLNGTWKFTLAPPENFWSNDIRPDKWADIEVPGECLMQGFSIGHNIGYPYKKEVAIPADFASQKILLRFDGVYSCARVWVNGHYVGYHHGGFTTWDCEITDLVDPGKTAWITIEVTDRDDDISYGSGYAHHLIGGILRDVWLLALPREYIAHLHIQTDLDAHYQNAVLKIDAALSLQKSNEAEIAFSLYDRNGKRVRIKPSRLTLTKEKTSDSVDIPVKRPLLWDAEHPHLYTLTAELKIDGKMVQIKSQRIGFREVGLSGNKLLVNGRPVKLRGACRHDVHPLLGRRTTRDLDRQDARLAKEANFNFIRTSHYPPSQAFLEFCDAYGIYVEEETAVCFVGTHRLQESYHKISFSQDDPAYTGRYLGQLAEMVERDRNHPSVILWSIGNENLYGANFQREYDWVKAADPTRPVLFSYPGKVPPGTVCCDILSLHYPSSEGHLTQYGIEAKDFSCGEKPVIYDEWAHVSCYNRDTLVGDPNVRNFWGESLKRFWDKAFESDAVGGAIWGMIDEVFLLPESPAGYGPWGIVDGWRRKKPEFWHAKKAYSPVRLLKTALDDVTPGRPLRIPVHNRFDHTNLEEISIAWTWRGNRRSLPSPDIPPHGRGEIVIPDQDWKAGETILIQFFQGRRFIDEESVALGGVRPGSEFADRKRGNLTVTEDEQGWLLSGEKFSCRVDRRSGLLEGGRQGERPLLLSGPYLHLRTLGEQPAWNQYVFRETDPESWRMEKIQVGQSRPTPLGQEIEVQVSGSAAVSGTTGPQDRVTIAWHYVIRPDGSIIINFEADNFPADEPAELGVAFKVDDPEWIEWQRRGLWTTYPDGHIGRLSGKALLGPSAAVAYREKPKGGWAEDVWDYFLSGPIRPPEPPVLLSADARSLKENILSYTIGYEESRGGLRVEAPGDQAARVKTAAADRLRLLVLTAWNYPDLAWGNYLRGFKSGEHRRGRVQIRLD